MPGETITTVVGVRSLELARGILGAVTSKLVWNYSAHLPLGPQVCLSHLLGGPASDTGAWLSWGHCCLLESQYTGLWDFSSLAGKHLCRESHAHGSLPCAHR